MLKKLIKKRIQKIFPLLAFFPLLLALINYPRGLLPSWEIIAHRFKTSLNSRKSVGKANDTAGGYVSKMEIEFLEPDLTDYGQEGCVSQPQDA